MRLIELRLKNLRCYKEEIKIKIEDLTCIIGKNDIGKSTILEALDCFFNENIDKGDLSSDCENTTIEISCLFDEIPKTIILDSSVETSPKEENIFPPKTVKKWELSPQHHHHSTTNTTNKRVVIILKIAPCQIIHPRQPPQLIITLSRRPCRNSSSNAKRESRKMYNG